MAIARLPAECRNALAASSGDVQHGNSDGVYQMLEESSCTDTRCTAWPCQVHKVSSAAKKRCTDMSNNILCAGSLMHQLTLRSRWMTCRRQHTKSDGASLQHLQRCSCMARRAHSTSARCMEDAAGAQTLQQEAEKVQLSGIPAPAIVREQVVWVPC